MSERSTFYAANRSDINSAAQSLGLAATIGQFYVGAAYEFSYRINSASVTLSSQISRHVAKGDFGSLENLSGVGTAKYDLAAAGRVLGVAGVTITALEAYVDLVTYEGPSRVTRAVAVTADVAGGITATASGAYILTTIAVWAGATGPIGWLGLAAAVGLSYGYNRWIAANLRDTITNYLDSAAHIPDRHWEAVPFGSPQEQNPYTAWDPQVGDVSSGYTGPDTGWDTPSEIGAEPTAIGALEPIGLASPVNIAPAAPADLGSYPIAPLTPTTSPAPVWLDQFSTQPESKGLPQPNAGLPGRSQSGRGGNGGDGSYYGGSSRDTGSRGIGSSSGSGSGSESVSSGRSGSSGGRGSRGGYASTPKNGPTPGSKPSGSWSFGGTQGGFREVNYHPVLLDLSGQGFNIDPLGESTRFVDLAGNGQSHRTAWAGEGTGVLVLDADGDGKISRSGEFAFTEWDETARSDLEALKNVFDTNHNGKLDAGDERWSEFKVDVDGELVSLDSLGITSIDLTPSGSGQTFADGSSIGGTTTFTRADGTTGTVGDATLVADASGYLVTSTETTASDGSKIRDILGHGVDGRLQFRNVVTTSADGSAVATSFDDDGNGTFDRSQTVVTNTGNTGERIKTVSNFNADGSLATQTVTATSSDLSIITTTIDQDGDGLLDERQIYERLTDGSTRTTTQSLSADGSISAEVVSTSSSDGLLKQTSIDLDADGQIDQATEEATVVNADGSRSVAQVTSSRDGTVLGRIETEISADSRFKEISQDSDGNGTVDVRTVTETSVGVDGTITIEGITYNQDGSVRGGSTSTRSSDGRTTAVATDIDGDQIDDFHDLDQTTVAADGSRVRIVERRSSDGTLLDRVETQTSVDGRAISETTDANGDGALDATSSTSIAADGSTTKVDRVIAKDGSLIASTTRTVSADGSVSVTTADVDGDGSVDLKSTVTKVTGQGGSVTKTTTAHSSDGTLLSTVARTTSADSLIVTEALDLDGDGDIDQTITDTVDLEPDGSRSQTVVAVSADGTLQSRTFTAVSSDRKTVTTEIDRNGDGAVDVATVSELLSDGQRRVTETVFAIDGSTIASAVTSTNASGLSSTLEVDENGDGIFDYQVTDTVTVNDDGAKDQVIETIAADGSLLNKVMRTTSGNGLTSTVSDDIDGDGDVDRLVTQTTTLDADGSKTTQTSVFHGNTKVSEVNEIVSGNGLSRASLHDLDGDGNVDRRSEVTTSVSATGATTTLEQVKTAAGLLLSTTSTNVTADKSITTTTTDRDGDGAVDVTEVTHVTSTGEVVKETTTIANGAVSSSFTETESANKLTRSARSDFDGDGIDDRVLTETTVLEADGSTVIARSEFDGSGQLIERTIVDNSADGLAETVTWQQSDASIERIRNAVTTRGADGSVTETVTFYGADGSLESSYQSVTSAHGLQATIIRDTDGDGIVDHHITRMLLANGTVKQTERGVDATGTTVHSRETATSADGLSRTTDFDTDGDGDVDKRVLEQMALNGDGSTTLTRRELLGTAGTLASETTTNVSADELTTSTAYDLDGDGAVDRTLEDVTVLNASGSTSRTVSSYSGADLERRYQVTTSANGLLVASELDIDGSGSSSNHSSDETVLNTDGTKTRTVISTGSAGDVLSQRIVSTSADGRTVTLQEVRGSGLGERTSSTVTEVLADGSAQTSVSRHEAGVLVDKTATFATADGRTATIERDANGDGTVDQRIHAEQRASGQKISVTTNFASDGSVANTAATTTSADGRTIVTDWDSDGDGSIDRRRTQVNTAYADGSSESIIEDENLGDGSLASRTANRKSADGMTEITHRDVDGDGTVDQIATRTIDASGAASAVVENNAAAMRIKNMAAGVVHWRQAIAATMASETSADGVKTTTRYDYDGDGHYELTSEAIRRIDGSIVTSFEEVGSGGVVSATGVLTTSADGEVSVLVKDENGDGTADLRATSTQRIDGSRTLVSEKLNPAGVVQETTEDRVSAFGQLFLRTVKDSLGRLTSWLTISDNGSSEHTTYDAASAGILSRSESGADGVVDRAILYDPLNTNPWSRIEQMFDAEGRKSTERQFLDNGNQVALTFHAASGETAQADYYDANGAKTAVIEYDVGNAAAWTRKEKQLDGAGRVTSETVVNDSGTKVASTFDATTGQKLVESSYTASGTIVSQTLFDPLNTTTWLRIERTYDSAGRLYVERQFMDAANRADVVYDVLYNNVDYIAYFDAAGRHTATVDYDQRNAAAWSRQEHYYDVAGRHVRTDLYNDNGTKVITHVDAANSVSWSTYAEHYNAAGQLTQVVQANDSGTALYIYLDPTNTQSWYRVETHVDVYGRNVSSYYYHDNGERTDVAYDPTNVQAWGQVNYHYATNGKLLNQSIWYDDGSRFSQDNDAYSQHGWSYVNYSYIADGRLQRQVIMYDGSANLTETLTIDVYNQYNWTQQKVHTNTRGWVETETWYDNGKYKRERPPRFEYDPVMIDLNRDGQFDFNPMSPIAGTSQTSFDWNGDGTRDETAWVGPTDGILVIDLAADGSAGPDGSIDQAREIAFSLWPADGDANPVSDLEGLRLMFDSNHDNVFDDRDDRWSEFRIWQDLNQDGRTDEGELRTLTEAGIRLINLIPNPEGAVTFADGSKITGTSTYQTTDGLTHLVADASFAVRPSSLMS